MPDAQIIDFQRHKLEMEIKTEILGADVPSPIDREAIGFGRPDAQRPTPRPVPRPVPRYEGPIPVNTRDTEAALKGYLNREAPPFEAVITRTWKDQQDAVSLTEVQRAWASGNLSQETFETWADQYDAMIVAGLQPLYLEALTAGAVAIAADAAQADPGLLATQFIREHGANLVVSLTELQRESLNLLLFYHTDVQPLTVQQLATAIQGTLPLTPTQSRALNNFRNTQRARLVSEGFAASRIGARVELMAGRRWAQMKRERAKVIARTELSFAYNRGQFEYMRQQVKEGRVDGTVVKRYWTALDERVCAFCGPLHGTVVGLESTFPGATKRTPNVFVPPIHPRCRCTIIYERVK